MWTCAASGGGISEDTRVVNSGSVVIVDVLAVVGSGARIAVGGLRGASD